MLQKVLAPALAPRPSWSVIARFSKRGFAVVVEGEITDEVDSPVAHRVLTEAGQGCASLARAVGVWASLVLDAEVERATPPAPPPEPPAPPPEPEAPPVNEKPSDRSVLLDPESTGHSFELGVTMSLMGGEGSGAMAGPTLYGIVEAGRGWFLRPAILYSRSLQELNDKSDVYGTLLATRFDLCGRISGFHIKRIMLDVCGGAEIGFMHFDQPSLPPDPTPPATNSTLPFLAAGPSLALRGELGGGLALVLRGVADLNLPEGFSEGAGQSHTVVSPSLFVGRAELGLSWQLR